MVGKLSDDARAVAAAWFGMSRPGGATLRFGMVQSRPSDRAQAGLDELVAAGIISREAEGSGAVVYRPLADCSEHLAWAWQRMPRGEAERNSFRLTERIEQGKAPRKRAGRTTLVALSDSTDRPGQGEGGTDGL